MSRRDQVAGPLLLLDACVAINLLATSEFDLIASSLDVQFWMVRQASLEVGQLRHETNGEIVSIPVDLAPHVTAGSLVIAGLEPDEVADYVGRAVEVGDGEAASVAVALGRGLTIATDDRKARRFCADRGLSEPLGTAHLLKAYCESLSLSPVEIGMRLRLIRDRASFMPPRSDPDHKWWSDHVTS